MKFEFWRDYKFENENDAKVFFETVKKEKNIIELDGSTVSICITEEEHINFDAFIWENINLWESYLGSMELPI